jgi:hypothetical protein
MFKNLSQKVKEKILYGVLIFSCLLIILNNIYLAFFHYTDINIFRYIVCFSISSIFIYFIYKLIIFYKSVK